MEIQNVFLEFFGDPSDDKECYKRYSSTQPFKPCGNDSEVIQFVNAKTISKILEVAKGWIAPSDITDFLGDVEKVCPEYWNLPC